MRLLKGLMLAGIAAFTLVGCGGGGDGGGGLFGAIAFNPTVNTASVRANYPTQKEADEAALRFCNINNPGCVIVLRFGPKQCGSIYVANFNLGGYGVAVADTREKASTDAFWSCHKSQNCTNGITDCNS
jgi:hypothetical protein